MTVLGSSNFNERSRTRDLELNFLIVTQNERLQQQMNQEVEQILQNAQPLSISNMEMPEYSIPWMCHIIENFVRSYFWMIFIFYSTFEYLRR